MSADVRVLRATRAPQDRAEAQRIREKAEVDRLRILAARDRIRRAAERMSAIYRERLEGRRRDD